MTPFGNILNLSLSSVNTIIKNEMFLKRDLKLNIYEKWDPVLIRKYFDNNVKTKKINLILFIKKQGKYNKGFFQTIHLKQSMKSLKILNKIQMIYFIFIRLLVNLIYLF